MEINLTNNMLVSKVNFSHREYLFKQFLNSLGLLYVTDKYTVLLFWNQYLELSDK